MRQKPSNILFGHVNFEFSFIVAFESCLAKLLILVLVFELIYVLNEKKNEVLIVIR
jgi:hypothetical protein